MVKKNQFCLAIDTASDITSVACVGSDGTQVVMQELLPKGQGEFLMTMIQQVLQQAQKTPQDLTHIAVTIGPGSFTGVRIGLATARGLGLALKIPVLGVDNFQATAFRLNKAVKIVLESKREDYFVQDFDKNGKPLGNATLQTTEELKEQLPFNACGSGSDRLSQEIGCKVVKPTYPLALSAAQIALSEPKQTKEPHPLYLRDADVSI